MVQRVLREHRARDAGLQVLGVNCRLAVSEMAEYPRMNCVKVAGAILVRGLRGAISIPCADCDIVPTARYRTWGTPPASIRAREQGVKPSSEATRVIITIWRFTIGR